MDDVVVLLVLILYCVISVSTADHKSDFQKPEQEDEFYGKGKILQFTFLI